MRFLRRSPLLGVLALLACDSGGTTQLLRSDAVPVERKPLGAACSGGTECESNICIRVAQGRAVCSGRCDGEYVCPAAPNWVCTLTESNEVPLCVCQSDAAHEICDDGLDNDCDGVVDCPLPVPDAGGGAPGADASMGTGDAGAGVPLDPCDDDPTLCGGCRRDAECDDGVACTRDACLGGGCVHTPDDRLCADDEVCTLGSGCAPGRACATDADCADMDACTQDEYCDTSVKICRWVLLDGDGDERYPPVCGGNDCDDDNATVYEGALDVCDGVDNDCDGRIDPPSRALACGADRVCFEGACVCDADHVPCEGQCFEPADLLGDDANCGACGQACLSGYVCKKGACADVNECADAGLCGTHSSCANTAGSYSCTCADGYASATGANCVDINECAANTDNCDSSPNACVNGDGDFECVCPSGYAGSGIGTNGCLDEDECALGADACDAALRCVNRISTYACTRATAQLDLGYSHTCALLDDGALKCWGYNFYGQLGLGDAMDRGYWPGHLGAALPALDFGTGLTPQWFVLGESHGCAILNGGSVKCWGRDTSGQLGLGTTQNRGDGANEMGDNLPAIDLGTGRTAKTLTASAHTCALLDDDTVKCWGANTYGQLGLGDTSHRGDAAGEMGNSLPTIALGTGRTAKALVAGGSHTCALLDNDTVKCWGRNTHGQLGLGDILNRGDGASEMGDNLPAIDLGTGRTARALAVGDYHTCALLDDDTVKCWGANAGGQLGLGDTLRRGDGANEMGDNLPIVDLGTGRTAQALTTSGGTCALLDDNSIKCWGENTYGQLGLGDTSPRGDAAGEMGDALPRVSLGSTHPTQLAVEAGGPHVCALLGDDTVKCWGYNGSGQLGVGDMAARGDNAGEMGDQLPEVLLGP